MLLIEVIIIIIYRKTVAMSDHLKCGPSSETYRLLPKAVTTELLCWWSFDVCPLSDGDNKDESCVSKQTPKLVQLKRRTAATLLLHCGSSLPW